MLHQCAAVATCDRTDGDIDLTPMLDVVFIMLIFFIVSASFQHETALDVALAASAGADTAGVVIDVDVAPDAVYLQQAPVEVEALRGQVVRLVAQMPRIPVVVRVRTGVSTDHLMQVLDRLRAAHVDARISPARQNS